MIKHPVWRALIGAAVALAVIWVLSRVLLSISWLTTLSWLLAWLVAIAVAVAVFVGLGRSSVKSKATSYGDR